MAGFHEVVYTEETKEAVQKRIEEKGPDCSCWRVSSTFFSHFRYNVSLKPLADLQDKWQDGAEVKYKDIAAKQQVEEELKAISLMKEDA